MAASDVKVLGALQSPFVNRVVMALKIKSVEYELVVTNPYKKNDLLIKYNPVHKKIPVLIHADKPICESLIIVHYIDDAWTNGPSILPADPYDRATARFWAAFIDEKWFPLIVQLRRAEGEEAKQALLEKISEGLPLLESGFIECSKGKAFFGGDTVGYLDIALGSLVAWIGVTDITVGTKILDERMTPRLVGWAERLYSDSLVKDVMLESKTLFESAKRFEAMLKASSDAK